MPRKKILYGNEARKALKSGVDKLAQAVITTLGPKGRNVAIDNDWSSPMVLHDGVSVAKEVELVDDFENMGAQMVKEAASKTNDKAGDGTTTATLLTQMIVDKGFKELNKPGSTLNPMIMNKGIEKALEVVLKEIKSQAKLVKGKDIEKVAIISAQNEEIGKLVAQAIEKVGKDGVVTAETGSTTEMSLVFREGMEFDKGYASPYFVTNGDKMEAELVDPAIILTDTKITDLDKFEEAIKVCLMASKKNIVIIADDFSDEALATLVLNKARGNFNSLAIKAPGFGDRKKEMLEDLAIVTGGKVISELQGRSLDAMTFDDLGFADRVWSDRESTKIIGGKGSSKAISDRAEQLRKLLPMVTADFDREKVQERLAKLTNGVAIINVGASSEVELKEKKERVIDAIAATKAALDEGIVPGGGITLFRIADMLKDLNYPNIDEKTGCTILREALKEPLFKIAENAGFDIKAVYQKLKEKKGDYGLNVLTGKYGSLQEMNIVDPVKVTRLAVENAVSVAMMILTTECLMTPVQQFKERDPYAR